MTSINALLANPLSLETLLRNNESYSKYFQEGYLPNIKYIEGNLYVKKYDEMIHTNTSSENYIARVIFFNEDGDPINDGNINQEEEDTLYTQIPNSGYMAYLIWNRPYASAYFKIAYLVDINQVQVEKDFETVKEGVSIGLDFVSLDMESIDYKIAKQMRDYLNDSHKVFNDFLKKCL